MSRTHRIILHILLSVLAWKIVDQWIVEVALWKFILIEILIACFELFATFVANKADGKSTNLFEENDMFQPPKQAEE